MSDFPVLLRLPCLAVVLVALLRACPGQAQSFDASGLDRPTELGGSWLMKPGDDLAYAQPGYDDSGWTRVDVSHDLHDYVRGPHPAVVWYRLHLRTSPTQTDLALLTHEFGRAWEIYANGSRILRLGRVAPYTPYIPWTRFVGFRSRLSDRELWFLRCGLRFRSRNGCYRSLGWIQQVCTSETGIHFGKITG